MGASSSIPESDNRPNSTPLNPPTTKAEAELPPPQSSKNGSGDPYNYQAILREADKSSSTLDQLRTAGVFLVPKKKKYWVDSNNNNCFTVFARGLSIIWGDDKRYWRWFTDKESDKSNELIDVAELIDVCWLEVQGKFEIEKLTPDIKYEVVFVVKMQEANYGWGTPVTIQLTVPNENRQERKENLNERPRGKWFELRVGEFTRKPKQEGEGEIVFSLLGYEGGQWKRGLVIKCAIIRPKP